MLLVKEPPTPQATQSKWVGEPAHPPQEIAVIHYWQQHLTSLEVECAHCMQGRESCLSPCFRLLVPKV